MTSSNVAARAGRWSARHRRAAILGWLAFVIVSVAIGGTVGTNTIGPAEQGTGESGRAEQSLARAFGERAKESVLIQSEKLTASDPAFRMAVRHVERRLAQAPRVENLLSPYAREPARLISRDRHSALVLFELAGDGDKDTDEIAPLVAAVAAEQRAHPHVRIDQFGDATARKAMQESFERDFRRSETLSVPITLVILVVAFGALIAAGVPLLLALSAVAAAIGLTGPVSQIAPMHDAVTSMVLLIGLAVGVDYSLFYLRREREERAAGRGERAALEAAAATSGRAVLISGLTVVVAMAGMYVVGDKTFSSLATGAILAVAVAVLGSTTVLPAVLSGLGDRVERGRVPFLRRDARGARESRLWSSLLDRVLRRPLLSTVAAAAALLALAAPALGLKTALPGIEGLPRDLPVTKTYERIQSAFPGGPTPAIVAVRARDVSAPEVRRAIAGLRDRALASVTPKPPVQVERSRDRTVAKVSVPLPGGVTDDRSNRALVKLRNEIIPATVARVPGARVEVTGPTAQSRDLNALMQAKAGWVFAFVLGLAFVLLLVTFRSIVVPIKAILLNLLSVAAAYGLLVAVFQAEWAEGLLGFESTGTIASWLPLFLFVVLFGLSMDYHVFILTRVREAFDNGMPADRAVAHGIKATAGVVTSAAVVMVAVFAVFATLSALEFKQMGVGLAAAVLIDATIVRAVLLPATMRLLGDWNWYLPRALRWLPRLEPPAAAEPPAGAQAEPSAEPAPA